MANEPDNYDPQRLDLILSDAEIRERGGQPSDVTMGVTARPAFDPARLDAALAQQAEPPSVAGEVTGVLSQTNQGIADAVGAPVDLVNEILGLASGGALRSEEPIGGSRSIKRLMPGEVQPQTTAGRVAGRISREVGANVTAGVGAAGVAGKLASMPGRIGELSKRLGTLDRASLARLESLLSLFTGSGAAAGQEFGRATHATPGQRQMLDFAGQLVGALGAAGARGLIGFFKRRDALPFQGTANTEASVGRALAEAIPEGSAQERNLRASGALQAEVPEVPLTTAQATGSGPIAAETRRMSAEPRRAAQLEEQPSRASEAVQQRLRDVQPIGDVAAAQRAAKAADAQRVAAETQAADTEAVRQTTWFKQTADRLNVKMSGFVESARRGVQDVLKQIGPAPRDRQAASEALLEAIAREDLKAKTAAGALFDKVEPNIPLNLTTLDSVVDDIVRYAEGAIGEPILPKSAGDLAAKLADGGASATGTFGEVRRWRTGALNELRNEAAKPGGGDREKRRLLTQLIDAIHETLDQAGETNAVYRAAAKAYKEYITRFRQGVMAKVQQRGPHGEAHKQAVETVAGEFFRSGKDAPTRAQAFQAAVGSQADATTALRDYAIGQFLETVAPGTKGATQRATRWLTKHREALDAFPGVRAEVQRVVAEMRGVDTAEELTKRMAKMTARGQLPAAANPAKLVGRSREAIEDAVVREFAGADPKDAIGTVLMRPDRGQQMQKLVTLVEHDPVAMDGLRRGFIEHLQDSIVKRNADDVGKSPLLDPDAMRNFLAQHADVVKALFPGAAGQRLDQLQRVAELVLFPNRAVNDASLLANLTQPQIYTMNQLLSRAYGIERNVISSGWVVGEGVIRAVHHAINAIGRDKLKTVLDRALFDPEAAGVLLDLGRTSAAGQAKAVRAVDAYVAALGPTAARVSGAPEGAPRRPAFSSASGGR